MRSPVDKCQAIGCGVVVENGHLLCEPHWRQIPRSVRQLVLGEQRKAMKNPKRKLSRAWFAMAAACVKFLRDAEATTP